MSGRRDDDEDDEDDVDDDRSPVAGVREIDHTADVALEIEAPDARTLFERAARGTVWLLFGRLPDDVGAEEVRAVDLVADDLPSLLRDWLGEVVFWHETEGWIVWSLEMDAPLEGPRPGDDDEHADRESRARDEVDRIHLRGTVRGGTTDRDPVREIKGVTRHGLAVERRSGGWFARVVFDV